MVQPKLCLLPTNTNSSESANPAPIPRAAIGLLGGLTASSCMFLFYAPPARVPRAAALASLYLLAVLGLQWAAGASRSGFGGHPDEGAHDVTGLMVRDYVAHGSRGRPCVSRRAFGHRPPVFLHLAGMLFDWSAADPGAYQRHHG